MTSLHPGPQTVRVSGDPFFEVEVQGSLFMHLLPVH
jgi:hypothetical protein